MYFVWCILSDLFRLIHSLWWCERDVSGIKHLIYPGTERVPGVFYVTAAYVIGPWPLPPSPSDPCNDGRLHGLVSERRLQHGPLALQLFCQRRSSPAGGATEGLPRCHLALDRHFCHRRQHCGGRSGLRLHLLNWGTLGNNCRFISLQRTSVCV